jgi:hypothetical protein
MFVLTASPRAAKKFRVLLPDGSHVDFGARGYSDYTVHKDKQRMLRYLARHHGKENWTRTGVHTAGFWSRWILWSRPSLQSAVRETERVLRAKIRVEI